MGKKITQYTAVTNTNPDTGSLLDVSEKSGSAYTTKKWSLLQLKAWLTTHLTIPFSSITSTPTTIGGYGITDAIDGSADTNKIPRMSDSNTIANSSLSDDGNTTATGGALDANIKMKVVTNTRQYAVYGEDALNGGVGVEALSTGDGAGANYAVRGTAEDSTTANIGVFGQAVKATIGKNVGIHGKAMNGAGGNYGARLDDGTQGIGKILKSATADGETNWTFLPYDLPFACSDETTALTAGTNKIVFRLPRAMVVTDIRASLVTAQASGSIFTCDINQNGTSILSTKLTIDNTEKTSVTAVTPAVLSTTSLSDDVEISVDIDQVGDGTAKGLKITILGYVLL
jgi:hypothetical protein